MPPHKTVIPEQLNEIFDQFNTCVATIAAPATATAMTLIIAIYLFWVSSEMYEELNLALGDVHRISIAGIVVTTLARAASVMLRKTERNFHEGKHKATKQPSPFPTALQESLLYTSVALAAYAPLIRITSYSFKENLPAYVIMHGMALSATVGCVHSVVELARFA